MVPADQEASVMSPDKLAIYTGLSLRTIQRLQTGEDWLHWMRVEERAPARDRSAEAVEEPPRRRTAARKA